jgi:hypothetical protein
MWVGDPNGDRRVPVPHGVSYRVTSPARDALVTPALARELARVLERVAVESGHSDRAPLSIRFAPGVVGHHQMGRAADIYGVGGVGLDRWKARWDKAPDARTNLGWRLYTGLRDYGRWSQPYGYPIQLFGPWTRTEGPWTHISDGLFRAHADHIHVAK